MNQNLKVYINTVAVNGIVTNNQLSTNLPATVIKIFC